MATQQERKTKTRLAIMKKARRLFEKHGFNETSLDQLITAANVAKGTFYQHFNTKLEVLIALEREAGRGRAKAALAEIAEGLPVIPIVEKYLESLAEWFEAREKIAEIVILSSLSQPDDKFTCDPELSTRSFIHNALDAAQKQGDIRMDADAWELTALVLGFITVSILGWSRNPQPGKLRIAFKRSMKLFLEGAQNTRLQQ